MKRAVQDAAPGDRSPAYLPAGRGWDPVAEHELVAVVMQPRLEREHRRARVCAYRRGRFTVQPVNARATATTSCCV